MKKEKVGKHMTVNRVGSYDEKKNKGPVHPKKHNFARLQNIIQILNHCQAKPTAG